MKLSKKKWLLVLGISIFVILVAGLGTVWSPQIQEQEELKDKLSLAQLRLNESAGVLQTSPQREALQNSLNQINSQLTKAKASLFQVMESIEVDQKLFSLAETSGVEIIKITSTAPTDMKLEGISCSALQTSLQIEGNITNILDFVRQWTEKFPTGTVVSMAISTQVEGSAPIPAQSLSSASVSLTLLTYAYSGD